jgi:hypothetical protein
MVSTAAAHCVSTLKPSGRLPFTHVASVFHPHVNGGLPVARSAFQDHMGSRTRACLSFVVHALQERTGLRPSEPYADLVRVRPRRMCCPADDEPYVSTMVRFGSNQVIPLPFRSVRCSLLKQTFGLLPGCASSRHSSFEKRTR